MYNGNALEPGWLLPGKERPLRIRLYTPEGRFFGLYVYRADEERYRLEKMFYGG